MKEKYQADKTMHGSTRKRNEDRKVKIQKKVSEESKCIKNWWPVLEEKYAEGNGGKQK